VLDQPWQIGVDRDNERFEGAIEVAVAKDDPLSLQGRQHQFG
jgi:hypothetical protein